MSCSEKKYVVGAPGIVSDRSQVAVVNWPADSHNLTCDGLTPARSAASSTVKVVGTNHFNTARGHGRVQDRALPASPAIPLSKPPQTASGRSAVARPARYPAGRVVVAFWTQNPANRLPGPCFALPLPGRCAPHPLYSRIRTVQRTKPQPAWRSWLFEKVVPQLMQIWEGCAAAVDLHCSTHEMAARLMICGFLVSKAPTKPLVVGDSARDSSAPGIPGLEHLRLTCAF